MIVLALDSTTPQGSVGLVLPDGHVVVRPGEAHRGWSERLPGELVAMLASHGLGLRDVDLFAVAAGPGSLTGLRVGIATMQGLAVAAARPLGAVSALEALASHGYEQVEELLHPGGTLHVGAWADARRGEVFSALYDCDASGPDAAASWRVVEEASVGLPAEIAARWKAAAKDGRLVIVGDVGGALGDVLGEALGSTVALVPRPLLGGYVARLALRQVSRGGLGSPHAVRPLYVRKPDAVLARERAGAAGARRPEHT